MRFDCVDCVAGPTAQFTPEGIGGPRHRLLFFQALVLLNYFPEVEYEE